MTTCFKARRRAFERLGGDETASRTANWLLEGLTGQPYGEGMRSEMPPRCEREYMERIERVLAGEPLAYILGEAQFREFDLAVGPGVLIPRPETEGLVDIALDLISERDNPAVLEIGIGSGAISIALAAARKDAMITATEISPSAAGYARTNIERYGLTGEIDLIEADLWPPGEDRAFDLIVSNPPYVALSDPLPPEVGEHEPREALFAGEEGTEVIERILDGAPSRLRPGGGVVLEIGFGQEEILEIPESSSGYLLDRDLFGVVRYLSVRF